MIRTNLEHTAQALVAGGKGILAADETVPTLTQRLAAAGIESTAETRRRYREMLITTPGISEFISGVILQHETIHQRSAQGIPLTDLLLQRGILPGIKVDEGVKALAGSPREHVTEGLDGLGGRLDEYRALGARFAKWRAAIAVTDTLPSAACIHANAHALARYAAICQERGMVPVVEPEVLMDGAHTIERCEEVTGAVLRAVFDELGLQKVSLEALLLKPNMVLPGIDCVEQASVRELAHSTLRCLRQHVPTAVPGVVFLSGGQDHLRATLNLSAINHVAGSKPWALSFSYGRALQDEALVAWQGRDEHLKAGQRAFYHRVRCVGAAACGRYTSAMESTSAAA
jgi:fructose-bisphosphate aldolase class I